MTLLLSTLVIYIVVLLVLSFYAMKVSGSSRDAVLALYLWLAFLFAAVYGLVVLTDSVMDWVL